MNTSLLNTINWIITNYGENILEHPERLKLLFKTHAKNEPVEDRVAFGRCIEIGCYKELKKANTNEKRLRIKTKLTQKLHKKTGIDIQQCSNAIDLLDVAIFKSVVQKQIKQKNTKSFFDAIGYKNNQISKKVKKWFINIYNRVRNKKLTAIITGVTVVVIILLISINRQNIINQNNNSQIPQTGTIEQNQLIEILNNELLMELLATKRQGMRDISGRILVNIVPINYRNRNFKMNPNDLRNTVSESLSLISQHAKEYNINISFNVVIDNGHNGRFMSLNNSTEAINLYQRFLNPRYDFTVLVLAIDTVERSYITRRADYAHAIMWFKEQNGHSANTLAHEIYHAFGAEDLYYEQGVVPKEVEQNFRTLIGDSIMLSSRFTRLDPINAWLIGWNKNPEPWFAWFVDRRDTSNINFFMPLNYLD